MVELSPDYVMKGLVDRGIRPVEAAGIIGNLWHESKLDTSIREINPTTESARKQGGGFGLAQWTDAKRKQGLYNMAQVQGKSIDDPDLQMDYLVHELNQPEYKKASLALQKSQSPRHAAYVFAKYYEMPSDKYAHHDKRMSIAEQALKMFNPVGEAQADDQPSEQLLSDSEAEGYKQFLANDLDSEAEGYKQFLANEDKPRLGQEISQQITNIGGGVIQGAADIGSNLLQLDDKIKNFFGQKYNRLPTKEERDSAISDYVKETGADPKSLGFSAGEMIPEIAATAGTGGALAKGMTKLAPSATGFIEALKSGGISGGNMADKIAAGVGTGLTGTAILDTDKAALGGAIGGSIPIIGKVGELFGAGIAKTIQAGKYMTLPSNKKEEIAAKIVELTGKTKPEVISMLEKGADVAEIPGLTRTVPQVLMNPDVSQLARTVKTNSSMALSDAEQAQQVAYKNALEGISPSNMTTQDAAEKAGAAISGKVKTDYKAITKQIGEKFTELRNNPDRNVTLPLDKLRATVDEYIGAGTVGKGSGAKAALRTAEDLSEVKPLQGQLPGAKSEYKGELSKAIERHKNNLTDSSYRGSHGAPMAGENTAALHELDKIYPNDIYSKDAHFIYGHGENDMQDKILLGQLKSFRGKPDEMVTIYRAIPKDKAKEINTGDWITTNQSYAKSHGEAHIDGKFNIVKMDVPAKTIFTNGDSPYEFGLDLSVLSKLNESKGTEINPVNFKELQNLRSSIGDLGQQAKLAGKNTESAALKQMVSDIDNHLDDAANNWEGDKPGWLDKYKEARGLHRAKMNRFKTGVQMGLFKPKANGEMAVEGGEIPGKFYSSKASQSRDVQSFKRLVNNDEALLKELKSYALTKAGQTATATGNLSQSFVKWAKTHSGANKELFSATEMKKINAISKSVSDSSVAENLGRVTGSDTAQKGKSLFDNGLIDSKYMSLLASKIPAGNAMLSAIKESSGRERSNLIAELLANPKELSKTLKAIPNGKEIAKLSTKDRNNFLRQSLLALPKVIPSIANTN